MKWIKIEPVPCGPRGVHCFNCNDYLEPGDDAVEGDTGTYCSQECCSEFETGNHGGWGLDISSAVAEEGE